MGCLSNFNKIAQDLSIGNDFVFLFLFFNRLRASSTVELVSVMFIECVQYIIPMKYFQLKCDIDNKI